MFRKISATIATVFLSLQLAGCAGAFIVGAAAGAVGAYAVSNDTVQGETDKPYAKLWNAACLVASTRGSLKQQDAGHGILEFEEGPSRISVRLIRLTRASVRLKITARRFHLPNLGLAQEVFVKIMEQAE